MIYHLIRCARRTSAILIAAVLLSTVATSCAPDAADSNRQINDVTIPKSGLWALSSLDPDAPWLPILASRDLAVGIQRLAFTLDPRPSAPPFDPANPPSIRASIYHLDQSQTEPRAVRFARFLPIAPSPFTPHAHAGSTVSDNASQISAGLYIIPLQLHAPGQWGILFQIQQDAANAEIPFRFSVRQRPAAPAVGDPAISVPTPTASDPAAIAAISSDPNPEPGLYARSLDDALAQRSPILLAFATPAYCHSRTCAPVLDIVKQVWRDHADRLTAIHVEIFRNPRNPERLEESHAFTAWRLPSEPWVFLISPDGAIRAAWEGPLSEPELAAAVADLLNAPDG